MPKNPLDTPRDFVLGNAFIAAVFSSYQSTPIMKKLSGPFVLAAILAAHIGFVVATEESYTFRNDETPSITNQTPAVDVTLSSMKGSATANPNNMVSLTDNNTRIN